MPVVDSLMNKLVAQYGKEKGERVYYAMEAEGKGPFAPGGKHRDLHEAFVEKHGLPGGVGKPVRGKKPAGGRPPGRSHAPAKRTGRTSGGRGR